YNFDFAKQYVKDNAIKDQVVLGGKRLISDDLLNYIVR
ncbi:hypothetical protein HMPREF0380_00413, partial [Eubacterium infirmum F0142]